MASRNKLFTLEYYRHFVKFGIVGAIGVVVNEGLLIVVQGAGVYFLTADAIAIEVSILSNFVLNDLWTFRDRRSGKAEVRLVKFNALMLAGLALNLAVVDAGTGYLGVSDLLTNLVGIAAAFLLRYALSVRYAWMRTENIESGEATPVSGPLSNPQKMASSPS
jgi:dolichol-phosphate mannosyltransferase